MRNKSYSNEGQTIFSIYTFGGKITRKYIVCICADEEETTKVLDALNFKEQYKEIKGSLNDSKDYMEKIVLSDDGDQVLQRLDELLKHI